MRPSVETAGEGGQQHRSVHFSDSRPAASPISRPKPSAIPQLPPSRWQRTRRFLCRLSPVVTLMYFVFLSIVAIIITTVTIDRTKGALLSTWETTHAMHAATVEATIRVVARRMYRIAELAAAFYVQSPNPVESNKTLTMLCAQLAMGDRNYLVRVLALGSPSLSQYASCTHADSSNPSPSNLTGVMTDRGYFYGSFYVNPTTYTYDDPPIKKDLFNTTSATQLVQSFNNLIPTLQKAEAVLNGSRGPLMNTELWTVPNTHPSFIYVTMPIMTLGNSVPKSPNVRPTDFAQLRTDGGSLLNQSVLIDPGISARAMILINQSLGTANPLVMSNNWLQPVVYSSSFSAVVNTNTTYLSLSNISDSLMREAIKHIDLVALQTPGNRQHAIFLYKDAPAIVTAWAYVGNFGLSLPLVVVSPHQTVAGSYITPMNVCVGTLAVAVLLVTAFFYFAIDRYLSRPLREVTAAMEASVERGVRQPVRGAACDVVQLAETRELACAYNAAMAQLRVVDAFVPDAVRATRRGGPALREHYLTVVTVRVRAGSGAGGAGGAAYGGDVGVDTSALLRRHPGASAGGVGGDRGRHGGGGLAALVNAVAEAATALTNSGPFASAASLSAFVAAVRELCEARGGTVHRAAPDECVLHFAANVRRVLSGSGAGSGGGAGAGAATGDRSLAAAVERAADADARAGVECALCVSRWVEQQQQQQQERGNSNSNGDSDSGSNSVEAVPDVRVVVDSGVFVCGEYRAPGSEQTLCVALGRDVAGAVGHVPAAIGVRVAATGEAALRVRGGAGGSAGGGTAAAAAAACSSPPPFPPAAAAAERGGFRVLPVEALRTGRAGLDGGAVTLYEVLPGAVDGDAAWLAYARCCDDGFECMVRGDYAGALRAYRGVGEICDLEPGLLPRCLSREAAHSDAVGGAVSVQVARLMRECERRVRAGSTAGYERGRHVPLGADAVLGVSARPKTAIRRHRSFESSRTSRGTLSLSTPNPSISRTRQSGMYSRGYASHWRYIITVNTAHDQVRRAVGGVPMRIIDNHGMEWLMPRTVDCGRSGDVWKRPFTALGSTGTLCTVYPLMLREGSEMFRGIIDAAADGPMADALRSAIPVWTFSESAALSVKRVFDLHCFLKHPSLVKPIAYSLSVEGLALLLVEGCSEGSVRHLTRMYGGVKPEVLFVLGYSILDAMCYLHSHGLVHGGVGLDTVMVGTDGVCRLSRRAADLQGGKEVFCRPRTCYVSPHMAAGNLPTPACDMFCYALGCLEAVSCRPAWTWATVPEGSAPHGTQEELIALMAEGGQAFSAAVVDGRVVPDIAAVYKLDNVGIHTRALQEALRQCLSYDPSVRPTSEQALAVTRQLLPNSQEVAVSPGEMGE